MGMMEKMEEVTSSGAREYLTFKLDQEEYGIDILKVQEFVVRTSDPRCQRRTSLKGYVKSTWNYCSIVVAFEIQLLPRRSTTPLPW